MERSSQFILLLPCRVPSILTLTSTGFSILLDDFLRQSLVLSMCWNLSRRDSTASLSSFSFAPMDWLESMPHFLQLTSRDFFLFVSTGIPKLIELTSQLVHWDWSSLFPFHWDWIPYSPCSLEAPFSFFLAMLKSGGFPFPVCAENRSFPFPINFWNWIFPFPRTQRNGLLSNESSQKNSLSVPLNGSTGIGSIRHPWIRFPPDGRSFFDSRTFATVPLAPPWIHPVPALGKWEPLGLLNWSWGAYFSTTVESSATSNFCSPLGQFTNYV